MNSYERTMARFAGQPVDRLPAQPIFMLLMARLIGRSYADCVTDHRVWAEGQLRLVDEFGVDMVSMCSDPWREAGDLGTPLRFFDAQPPAARAHLLADKAAFASLTVPDPHAGPRMSDRIKAVALLREQVGGQVPILGWVEGPVAEAADLRGMNEIMLDFLDDPCFARDLLAFCTEMEIRFARAQVEAGADAIGIGDAAASLISADLYRQFVVPGERRIADAVHEAGAKVRLHICGNTNHLVADMRGVGADQVELDWPVDLAAARQALGADPIMSGNMDPVRVVERGTPEQIKRACAECHEACGERYILAAGCEIPPEAPLGNVRALFEYAAETT